MATVLSPLTPRGLAAHFTSTRPPHLTWTPIRARPPRRRSGSIGSLSAGGYQYVIVSFMSRRRGAKCTISYEVTSSLFSPFVGRLPTLGRAAGPSAQSGKWELFNDWLSFGAMRWRRPWRQNGDICRFAQLGCAGLCVRTRRATTAALLRAPVAGLGLARRWLGRVSPLVKCGR